MTFSSNRRKNIQRRHMPGLINKYFYYFIIMVTIFIVSFMFNTEGIPYKFRVNITTANADIQRNNVIESTSAPVKDHRHKYILLWTSDQCTPFVYFGKGVSVFKKKNCTWSNCYITNDRNYLGHYTEFDIIAFNGPQLSKIAILHDIPSKRDPKQKYVYANIEAASNYPITNSIWNGYFNWTWTYKLNSDAIWGYIAIKNATKHVIGPSSNMHWIDVRDMEPITNELKDKLKYKTKAAAWFSSNCITLNHRELVVKEISKELRKYNLEVDVYGTCGTHHCPREIMDKCLLALERNYFFYFAFENAHSEDYVTEKIVYALNHNTVPVVFGGANYTRFMPDGIYLDVMKLGPKLLAKKISDLIKNPEKYYEFFKWKKYYSYHFRNEDPATDDYCNFCAMANDEKLISKTTVYKNVKSWWENNDTYDNFTYTVTI